MPEFETTSLAYDGTEQSVRITNFEGAFKAIEDIIKEAYASDPSIGLYERDKVNIAVIINGDPSNEIDITRDGEIRVGTKPGDTVIINTIVVFYDNVREQLLKNIDTAIAITQRPLIIKPADVEYTYDGTLKTPSSYQLVNGTSLCDNDVITSIGYGSYGPGANTYDSSIDVSSLVITHGTGATASEVTSYYTISVLQGALSIVDPDAPSRPIKPGVPSDPVKPDAPSLSAKTDAPSSSNLPKTGDNTPWWLLLSLGVATSLSIICAVGISRHKRRSVHNKQ